MSEKSVVAKAQGYTIVCGVVGAIAGYAYAKEVGAILGFLIGLFVGNYIDRRR